MGWVLLFLLWVACAGVAAFIAQSKGRDVGSFALAGLFLGPVGVIIAACAEKQTDRTNRRRAAARTNRQPADPLPEIKPMNWRD